MGPLARRGVWAATCIGEWHDNQTDSPRSDDRRAVQLPIGKEDDGGTRTESLEEAADKAARAIKEEAAEAKATLAKRLDQLDAEIDSLEARAKKATAKSRL